MKHPLHEDAFTGIEAAIVLIAFITVASVFTYIMLGTGFFATQTSQKVANAGVQGASSNIIVVGDIYGLASDTSLGIDTVSFGVTLSKGGTPVDFRGSQMIISTEGLLETLAYTAGAAGEGQWNVSGTTLTGCFLIIRSGRSMGNPLERYRRELSSPWKSNHLAVHRSASGERSLRA